MDSEKHKEAIEKHLGYAITQEDVEEHSGWDFDVYLIDGYVFRFPKSQEIAEGMQKEKQILDVIKPHITAMRIPSFIVVDNTFMYGKSIPGDVLPYTMEAYNETVQNQIVSFMKELHAIPKNTFPQSHNDNQSNDKSLDDFVEGFKQSIAKKLDPLLTKNKKKNLFAYVDELYYKFQSPGECIVHTDIQGKNLLHDPNTHQLTGVIDFSNTRIGSRELDFCHFYDVGEDLLWTMIEKYFGVRDEEFFNRVYFLARRGVLYCVYNDEEFKENRDEVLDNLKKYEFL